MRLSTAKDLVIRTAVKDYKNVRNLGIDEYLLYDVFLSLSEEGYISILEITTISSGPVKAYDIQMVYPKAVTFVNSNKSFRKKEIQQWLIDAPKNFWFIGALLTLIASQSALIIKAFSKEEQRETIKQIIIIDSTKSDTIYLPNPLNDKKGGGASVLDSLSR